MLKIKKFMLLLLLFSIGNVFAKEHQVKMLNGSAPDMFIFEPAVLNIKKGDTVTWTGDAMHNSASIKEMLPKGAKPWMGKLTKKAGEKSISVKFDIEGLYGYNCTPHAMFGMVGIITVGDVSVNSKAAKTAAKKLEEKFAAGKGRFSKYLLEVK
ncbi:plastocyanin/azurin family copper-binding protein [Methylophilaceae bacterium]|jgi:pseudoazurin|nr:plastocyanin/azurin family copper-binding protein [Methylophilaceae bacterium]|tara:strand:- start:463 stop:924 length:462 start_codon:yes stop_codon:yes gene_type:complete